ncbi:F0F1 ATP synthase, F0 complex, subunit A [Candidatus Desulfofervidus auxilii]|uniref:ATP synthase subunit a n=1 Tax=Desulfofervidus auxilii TaxID=1621989 RepID=A0A7U4QLC7_DESA2|nr:F0F1 ATP synthase subunit A [Candidatus Desulfofervidus auxilii]AMM41475.1 F0F1 ATP synthase, F0 complex, subunit A [Candidatus Desulfofervidus auxilii]
MEHPILFMTVLFEKIGLGAFAHHYPQVINSWLAMIILIVLAFLVKPKIDPFHPPRSQVIWETIIKGIEDFTVDITGEEGRPYYPLVATLFIYIFLCNIMGLAPGLMAPTANLNTNLSMALVSVIFAEFIGFKKHGVKYIRHYTGPILPLAPLFIPIEIIGRLARILSLTFRLFGNIVAKELIIGLLIFLAGAYLAPVPLYFLFILLCFIQAFIFYMLSAMYLAGALEEAH